jgi:hypothetical protein
MSTRTLVAAAATISAAAAGATIAGGQGSQGPPSGTLSFQYRIRQVPTLAGINPAVPRDKKRPKVADVMAANADVLSTTGARIGRAHDFGVTTFEGARKYKGNSVSISNTFVNLRNGDTLFMHCARQDSPTNNLCAVVGGTGRYAGARGSAVEDLAHAVQNKRQKTLVFTVTVNFVT